MASVSEQLKKLKERERKIEEEADAKRKEVEAEIAKLRDSAKDEVMSSVASAVETLKGYGHSIYEIGALFASQLGLPIGKAPKGTGRGGKGVKRVTNTDQPCKVCGFKTVPYHDGRQHRSQTEKKPFTAKELSDMGMKKA